MNCNQFNKFEKFENLTREELIKELEIHYEGEDSRKCLTHSRDIALIFWDLFRHSKKESVTVLYINSANQPIEAEVISKNGMNDKAFDYKEIFRKALRLNSAAIITGHKVFKSYKSNESDRAVVNDFSEKAQLVGLEYFDHVVCYSSGHFSYHGNGKI